MIATTQVFTATRITGVAAYAVALISCVVALFLARADRERERFAVRLAAFEGFLLLDMVFNWRWDIHQFLMDKANQAALYASRRGHQTLVLAAIVLLFIFAMRLVSHRLRGRPDALLAAAGALLSLVLWCTEVVSLHAVDHILYHPIGQWMMVSFLWIIASVTTSVGILRYSKSAPNRVRMNTLR